MRRILLNLLLATGELALHVMKAKEFESFKNDHIEPLRKMINEEFKNETPD